MKWRCCCCGRVFHRLYERHRCVSGFTKSWHKVAKKLGLADAWTQYHEFGDYELMIGKLSVRSAYVVEFSDGHSELVLIPVSQINFKTGLIVVVGEVSLVPSLHIPESVSLV